MAIENTYRSLLFNTFVAEQVGSAASIDFEDIEDYIKDNLTELDLSVPQFDASDYEITLREISSAAKFNNTFKAIRQDLRVLYKEMLNLSKVSIEDFERWRVEADILERRLSVLENTVQSRLLLAQDTEGYHSFIFEDFSNLANIDMVQTTVAIDVSGQQVFLDSGTNVTTSQLLLNDIENEDVSFKVRTSVDFISREQTGDLLDVFTQRGSAWRTIVKMGKDEPVVCELLVQLGDEPVSLSSIYIELNETSGSNPVTITPLYSTDNYNFSQLPTVSYSKEIISKANFNFSTVDAKWVKFLLAKDGKDLTQGVEFHFEFGFKDIFFYAESFTENVGQDLVTETLSIVDTDGVVVPFSRVALEVCEVLEEDTDIKYFITAGSSSSITVNDNTVWYPISPASREQPLYPKVLDLGDLTEVEVTGVGVSYSRGNNPNTPFNLLSKDTDDTVLDESIAATATRYVFTNTNERILDYQIKDIDYVGSGTGTALEIDEDNITIFRNIGERGLTVDDTVRRIQRGWRYEEPYYITIVEILDPNGISIDVGDNHIIIDGKKYTNQVGGDVLSGRTKSFNGLHEVKVYKSNWRHATPDLDTLTGTSGLIAADSLYPYNHKLLIEGYSYGTSFPSGQERIYLGADTFFERRMRKISAFDLVSNASANDYQYYALDRDAPTTHTGGNSSTRVFVVKVNERNPDLINEEFEIRFNMVNLQYSYFRLKATLSTGDENITPSLDSFKLKFGG
jgi:hypothetical protein